MPMLILSALIFGIATLLQGAEPRSGFKISEDTVEVLFYNTEKYSLLASTRPDVETERKEAVEGKSGAKAALFSAIVPGSGELYAKSYWKAALFAAVEVAAISGYFIYENKGDDEDLRMRRFGDMHWSEQRYWSHVYQIAVREDLWDYQNLETDGNNVIMDTDYDAMTVARLREIERNNTAQTGFTHSLPETKTQQYYEMIYKYLHQFGAGWDDIPSLSYYEGQTYPYTMTPNISKYRDMRNRSNDYYQTATTITSVILLNHLVSAIDAALSVKTYNKKLEYAFQVSARRHAGEIVRTYGINLSW